MTKQTCTTIRSSLHAWLLAPPPPSSPSTPSPSILSSVYSLYVHASHYVGNANIYLTQHASLCALPSSPPLLPFPPPVIRTDMDSSVAATGRGNCSSISMKSSPRPLSAPPLLNIRGGTRRTRMTRRGRIRGKKGVYPPRPNHRSGARVTFAKTRV